MRHIDAPYNILFYNFIVTSETLDKILSALNVPADILFSFEHLKDEEEIVSEIYTYIGKIKLNPEQLEKNVQIAAYYCRR